MRILVALLLLVLLLTCGCSTKAYSFFNGNHFGKHLFIVYEDLHHLHVDIDRVLFDIYETDDELRMLETN